MVAFAIATLALSVLSQIFGQGSRHLDLSRDYTEALAVAENLMAEFGQPKSANSEPSSYTRGRFHGRVEVSPYGTPARAANPPLLPAALSDDIRLIRISVEVQWVRSGQSRSITLESLRIVTSSTDAT